MLTWKSVAGLAITLCGLMAGGCSDGRDDQIRALQEDKQRLDAENGRLSEALAASQTDAERARQRAVQLQAQLDEALRKLGQDRASNLPPGWEGTRTIAWTNLSEDVLFDSGKATLKPGAKEILRNVVGQIQGRSDWAGREVWVVGHTDSDPIKVTKNLWQDNLDLSVNRATAVVREFWAQGLDKKRVVAAGQGEFAPRMPNTSKDNKSKNRRVQIITVEKPDNSSMGSPAPGGASRDGGGEQG